MKFEMLHKGYFNCIDDCLTTLLNYYGKEYMPIFGMSWRVLNWNEGLEDISIHYNNAYLIKKYCNIDCDLYFFKNHEEFRKKVTPLLEQKKPAIIAVDMYDLPWSDYYKKINMKHCLIVKRMLENGVYEVCDATQNIDTINFNIGDILGGIATLTFSDCGNSEIDFKNIIKDGIKIINQDIYEKKAYYPMELFIEKEFSNMKKVYAKGSSLLEIETFFKYLLALERGRMAFSELISYMIDKHKMEDACDLRNKIRKVAAKYASVRLNLVKETIKNDWESNYHELADVLKHVIEEDKKAARELSLYFDLEKGL